MTLRTAKHSLTANTFGALAASQAEMQGAFPAVEIGKHAVDVDGAETADDMAILVRAELSDAFRLLADEALLAGDEHMAALALDAIDGGAVASIEACCAAICNTAAG